MDRRVKPGGDEKHKPLGACHFAVSSLFCGGFGDPAMRFRPAGRVVHEFLDLRQHFRIELVARLGDRDDVPPGRKRMQLDWTPLRQHLLAE
jgi:hypothetical protein